VRQINVTKRICLVTAAAALGALGLLGCGSGHRSIQPVAASSPVARGAQSAGPGSIPVVRTAREGHPFRLSYEQNGAPTSWQITLDSVTCGDGTIFSAKVLAAAAESTGQSAPATPEPEQGQQFCLVKYGVTNDSTSNQPWQANGSTLNVGMNAYQAAQSGPGSDVELDYTQDAQPGSDTSDFGINPGVSAVSWAVFEIPARRPSSRPPRSQWPIRPRRRTRPRRNPRPRRPVTTVAVSPNQSCSPRVTTPASSHR
jgi:hypothetical protein